VEYTACGKSNGYKTNSAGTIHSDLVLNSGSRVATEKDGAFDAAVRVAFGTDAAVYPHGLNTGTFHVHVKLGMTPLAAIQSATINAADLLGWTKQVGTLEPAKWAGMIAVDGDPTKGSRHWSA
jgi:imidazolonepropionase-like amidohydrolase